MNIRRLRRLRRLQKIIKKEGLTEAIFGLGAVMSLDLPDGWAYITLILSVRIAMNTKTDKPDRG